MGPILQPPTGDLDLTMWVEVRRALVMAVRAVVRHRPNWYFLMILFGVEEKNHYPNNERITR